MKIHDREGILRESKGNHRSATARCVQREIQLEDVLDPNAKKDAASLQIWTTAWTEQLNCNGSFAFAALPREEISPFIRHFSSQVKNCLLIVNSGSDFAVLSD